MNMRFIISVVVIFILSMGFGFLIHGMMLKPHYEALPELYRGDADAQNYFSYMILAHVLIAIGFTWIYRMGRQDKPWLGQGIRFGFAVALLTGIPVYLIYYAVQPNPQDLVMSQIMYELPALIIMGIVAAFINQE